MRFPPIALTKIVVYLLLTLVVLGLILLVFFKREPAPSLVKPKAEETTYRRGDDPTYAEELKKMTALLQDMGYRFKESESQRALEREQTSNLVQRETQRAIQKSQQDVEQLHRALQEARKALDDKIQAAGPAPQTQQLRAEIERLTREQGALREQLATGHPAALAQTRPEANRILSPEAAPPPASEAQPNDRAPGAPQVDRDLLERLRSVPGLEGVTDRLAGYAGAGANASRPASGVAKTKTAYGLQGHYITFNPYIAGEHTGQAQAHVRNRPEAVDNADRFQPKRYPFAVKLGQEGASAVIPVYTIPDAATLVHNSTLTPLVGRVPVRGSVRDPFRFKLITGATNLATNGHRIPGIVHAVWTGYAVGIREQSCVRAYLDTVTFTFEDGRLHTVHKGKGTTDTAASVNENLGYLTDQWGKPCIRGAFFNNAGEYLQDRSLAAFLEGLAQAYAASQVTGDRDVNGLSTYVSGNTYEYALGRGMSGTTGEIAHYVRERADGVFDVVYVPPGIDVQIFVESQIAIDYQTDGRKLTYDYASPGASHAALD